MAAALPTLSEPVFPIKGTFTTSPANLRSSPEIPVSSAPNNKAEGTVKSGLL